MILVVEVQGTTVIGTRPQHYLDEELRKLRMNSIGDEPYANRLENRGWTLVSVIPIIGNDQFDKELWFRKDQEE